MYLDLSVYSAKSHATDQYFKVQPVYIRGLRFLVLDCFGESPSSVVSHGFRPAVLINMLKNQGMYWYHTTMPFIKSSGKLLTVAPPSDISIVIKTD